MPKSKKQNKKQENKIKLYVAGRFAPFLLKFLLKLPQVSQLFKFGMICFYFQDFCLSFLFYLFRRLYQKCCFTWTFYELFVDMKFIHKSLDEIFIVFSSCSFNLVPIMFDNSPLTAVEGNSRWGLFILTLRSYTKFLLFSKLKNKLSIQARSCNTFHPIMAALKDCNEIARIWLATKRKTKYTLKPLVSFSSWLFWSFNLNIVRTTLTK